MLHHIPNLSFHLLHCRRKEMLRNVCDTGSVFSSSIVRMRMIILQSLL